MGQHSGIFIILKGGCFKSVPAEFYKTPCQLLNVILWRNMKHPLHLAAGVMFLKMKDLPVITQIFGCLQTLLESLSSVKVLIIDPFMMYTAAGLSKHLQYVIHVCWLLIKGVEKWYRLFCSSDTSQFRFPQKICQIKGGSVVDNVTNFFAFRETLRFLAEFRNNHVRHNFARS